MVNRIEHANMTVRDIDATLRFLSAAFPDFRVRGGGGSGDDRWVHVGNDETYVALSPASVEPAEQWLPYAGHPGVNHLGFEVDDVDALRARLQAAGFDDSTVENAHPYRRRIYFRDPDGNDWEFVQYFSASPAERNDYALADS